MISLKVFKSEKAINKNIFIIAITFSPPVCLKIGLIGSQRKEEERKKEKNRPGKISENPSKMSPMTQHQINTAQTLV